VQEGHAVFLADVFETSLIGQLASFSELE
jgi:hypothetical protein